MVEKYFTVSVVKDECGSGGFGGHTSVTRAPNLTVLIYWKKNIAFGKKCFFSNENRPKRDQKSSDEFHQLDFFRRHHHRAAYNFLAPAEQFEG